MAGTLSDSNNAATLLSAFEEKEELASLVTESLSDSEKKDNGTGIQVYIGNEDVYKRQVIEKGVQNVKRILADNFVRPDESQKILSQLRKKGSHTCLLYTSRCV